MTLGLIVQWTLSLYQRDIDDLPLILALQDEIRIKPEDKGGKPVSFKDLSVNEILDEGELKSIEPVIDFAPVDQSLLDNELSPAIKKNGQGENNIADSITDALETLLGISNDSSEVREENIELHIASYGTADKANAHWFLLQQVNSDLLVNYNHRVVKVISSDKEIYRLRVVGFKSIAMAQDMCDRLVERGENCVPSIRSE